MVKKDICVTMYFCNLSSPIWKEIIVLVALRNVGREGSTIKTRDGSLILTSGETDWSI
jgi:hypothetical protein